jgi:periplasmic copper chaperone A
MRANLQRQFIWMAPIFLMALAMQFLAPIATSFAMAGPIKVENAFTRPTLGGASVAVGYMILINTGKTDDWLESVTSDISATSEIHETKMENGMMEMRELPKGLAVPAGATVSFKPGAYHIMFVGIKHAVKPGDTIHATLTFEKAGKIAVDFPAADNPGAMAPSGGMGGMKMH